ncbi:hypothetical protein FRC16_000313 [Serendipita sp. 398]|nr:hypothetical protein FRC16_000313 [Serendipita sp. 398]
MSPMVPSVGLNRFSLAPSVYSMWIFNIFWLAAAASLSNSIPGNCSLIDECGKVKSLAAFAWITLIVFAAASCMLGYQWIFGGNIQIRPQDPVLPTTNPEANTSAINNTTSSNASKINQVASSNVSTVASRQTGSGLKRVPTVTSKTLTTSAAPSTSSLIERLCIQCSKVESADGSVYCGADCILQVRAGAPRMMVLPAAHYMFRAISDFFSQTWLHNTTKPVIQYIYVIVSKEENDKMYRGYREGVESVGKFREQGLKDGNEQFRWHGTSRECKVGDPGNNGLCESISCATCNIIRHSYDIDRFGPRWGRYVTSSCFYHRFVRRILISIPRFGKGIYTSATSSKSNDYTTNNQESNWTALLLNSVLIGRGFETKENHETLLQPPEGYDSVLGVPGETLNYDETVVYRNDAIRPAYLVVYLTPTTQEIEEAGGEIQE